MSAWIQRLLTSLLRKQVSDVRTLPSHASPGRQEASPSEIRPYLHADQDLTGSSMPAVPGMNSSRSNARETHDAFGGSPLPLDVPHFSRWRTQPT